MRWFDVKRALPNAMSDSNETTSGSRRNGESALTDVDALPR
jgi:hypothetical protein